ncbi:hypothetical protein [Microbacterium aquimaris]|uniref:Transcriptional regulator, AbiEi antitoxin, Type IV TA system n=1 Tax=Microbacterium aquimaris TaxID=459816 RepID=A0ABU5N4W8_9MICO|nr:hypothetical protein [Microbacterium aquimaris]MDZ8161126.1 hypothetical protein [Microbacterium aquimaris]
MPDSTSLLRPSPVPLHCARAFDTGRLRVRADQDFIRVRTGVYAERRLWHGLAPWDRYLARVHAVAARRPGTVFAFESAAALLGLPIFGEPADIHVYDPERSRSRRFGDVAVHTSEDPRMIRSGVISVTSVADTTLDLLRVLTPAFALAVADAAIAPLRSDAADRSHMRALAESRANPRRRDQVLWAVDRADPRSESPGESISRAVIEWSGFEAPELQRWFSSEGFDDRVDFFFPRARAIGESDGYGKYAASEAPEAVRAIVAEKRREDRLRRQCDGFARWDRADALAVTPLRRKLHAAGLRPERAEHAAMLATLATRRADGRWR